ncbi:MAG: hypothetical protein DELT_02620 [Desulfovibrio sp.]
MNIILTHCSKQLSHTDIDKAETILSISLPDDIKAFYLKYNGGNSNKTLWCDQTGRLDALELREFIPLIYARPEYNKNFTLEKLTKRGWSKRELPLNFIIFAMDSGENFYCIDHRTQEIYYFVRDVWSDNLTVDQNFKINSKRIAHSFMNFLDELVIDEDC